ncbi:MAG: LLM class flavin-dependent oxidoreductase [Thermoleophilia bacterium]
MRATPESPGAPEVWVLGSGGSSAVYAAYFGLPFAYAHFINPQGGEQQAALFRERYQPSPEHPGPRVAVAAAAICAATDEEAERLAQSVRLWRLRLERGDPGPIPSIEEAEAYPYTEHERSRIAGLSRRYTVGSPGTVRARLTALAEAFGAEELVIVTICHDPEARRRSYELLATAFDLEPREPAGAAAG